MAKKALTRQIIEYVEMIRKEEEMSVKEFAKHFDITVQSYYEWKRSLEEGNTPAYPKLSTIEKGLRSLGYDPIFFIDVKNKLKA